MKLFIVFAAIVAGACAAPASSSYKNAEDGGGMTPMRQGRIVGGSAVSIESFPWIVSVRRLGAHRCGGSIITTNRMLTAAHCTDGIEDDGFEVRAGSTQHGGGGQLIASEQTIEHPQFNAETMVNDICVVWLESSFDYSPPGVAAINMHAQGAAVAAGTTVNVAGWGATCEGCPETTALRAVSKPVVSNPQCNAQFGGGIAAGMLCAGFAEGGRGACEGDNGGPLSMGTTLVGIYSWSRGCARPNLPSVYTRVGFYRTWINANM